MNTQTGSITRDFDADTTAATTALTANNAAVVSLLADLNNERQRLLTHLTNALNLCQNHETQIRKLRADLEAANNEMEKMRTALSDAGKRTKRKARKAAA